MERSSVRWWTLAVMGLCLLVLGLDSTVLNVALPTLVRELGASTSQLQWILDTYLLVFGGLLLTMGRLGDRFGRKLLLQAALVLFLGGSLLCAFAASPDMLILARGVQGLGAAAIMPLTLAILPVIFPVEEERTKAIAIWSAAAALGLPLGPIVAGVLLREFWWGSVFLINVPVIVLALVAGAVLIPESKDTTARGGDPLGVLLSVGGLVAFLYGVITGPTDGWTDIAVLATLAAGGVLLTAFVLWERRTRTPMLDVSMFRNPRFGWAIAAMGLTVFGLVGLMFTLTQYLQFVLGYSALTAGIALLPLVVALAIAAPISAQLVLRIGAKIVIAAGLAITAAGLMLFSTTSLTSGYALTGSALAVVGVGMGLAMAQAANCVMGAVPVERAGQASATLGTIRSLGAAVGVAVLGSILSTAYVQRIADALSGLPPAAAALARDSIGTALQVATRLGPAGTPLEVAAKDAFVHGMDLCLVFGAAFTLAGALLVLARLPARPVPTQRDGELAEAPDDTKAPPTAA